MSVDFSGINFLAVIVAVVIQFAAGAAWYGVLSAPWLAAVGKTREEIPQGKNAMTAYLIALIGSVIGILALATIIQAIGADSLLEGLLLGLTVGVGFVATSLAAQYSFEGRPLKLYFINAGYPVLMLAIAGSILGVWQ